MKFILNSLEKSWKNWKKSWINWKKSWINWEKNLLAPKKNSTRVLLSVLQRGWLHPCSRLIFYLINFYQLSAAVDSWWQLIWIIFDWNFHVHSIGDICAKFQLSRLTFIFISCQQLFAAVYSWRKLSQKKIWLRFLATP